MKGSLPQIKCWVVFTSSMAAVALAQSGLPEEAFDQTRLAFMTYKLNNPVVYVMFADATGRRRLTVTGAQDPAFSPVGDQIAFSGQVGSAYELFVMDGGGGNWRQLTYDGRSIGNPSFSPDSQRIAYFSNRLGHDQIYVINTDGTERRNISENEYNERSPSWSPDGTRIAFRSGRSGNGDIYVMDPNGANVVRLTTNTAIDSDPAWSPDGARIAFASDRDSGVSTVYVMNADGSDQKRIAFVQGIHCWGPTWSRDGGRIAFFAYRDGLYYVNPDGTGLMRAAPKGEDRDPSFGPRPVVAFPLGYEITRGERISGGNLALQYSDDEYLWIEARPPFAVSHASIEVVLSGTAPAESAVALSFVLEASAAFLDIPQRIELYNSGAGAWETLDERGSTTNDSVVALRVVEAPDRFIAPGTRSMQARISYRDTGVAVPRWFARLDQAVWVVTPR